LKSSFEIFIPLAISARLAQARNPFSDKSEHLASDLRSMVEGFGGPAAGLAQANFVLGVVEKVFLEKKAVFGREAVKE